MKDKLFADFSKIDTKNISFALDEDPPFTDSIDTFEEDAPPLTPSMQGRHCLGNGRHPEYNCLCDECDYFLFCFPQFDFRRQKPKAKKKCYKLKGCLF